MNDCVENCRRFSEVDAVTVDAVIRDAVTLDAVTVDEDAVSGDATDDVAVTLSIPADVNADTGEAGADDVVDALTDAGDEATDDSVAIASDLGVAKVDCVSCNNRSFSVSSAFMTPFPFALSPLDFRPFLPPRLHPPVSLLLSSSLPLSSPLSVIPSHCGLEQTRIEM